MRLNVDPSRPHLGGDVLEGDPKTWCPGVWEALAPPGTKVVDIGCGEGHALQWFQTHGCFAMGIDGLERKHPGIIQHDYTEGPLYWPWGEFDLAWSCEFLEHVEERFVPNFLGSFAHAKRVAVTAAAPGQDGHHHVNCQTKAYWKGVFAALGYEFNPALTWESAQKAKGTWFWENGMIFDRRPR